MEAKTSFRRSLSLLDGTLLVAGSMIGSGIFIVSADISRVVGSAGWLIVVWLISGFITLAAAMSYGELSGMFPQAGGQYAYLREAHGKLIGFLYGWSFFAVIQTGTIAAVAVAFAKFAGYLVPAVSETHILFTSTYFTLTAAQLTGILVIVLLSYINTRGVKEAKWIQFIFTFAKILAMAALVIFGFLFLTKAGSMWAENWNNGWMAKTISVEPGVISHTTLTTETLIIAICTAMVGAIFSSDAWNNVTFIAAEIKKPERNIGLSLFIGTLVVTLLYLAMNFMYINVLSIHEIATAPQDRVALAASLKIFGNVGTLFIALLVMVSTFGCNNGLILSGARLYNTMACDGLFLPAAKKINKNGVPGRALWMQCIWASLLCLSGKYGQLLDFITFTALLFYILTIAGIFILRKRMPDHPRPYKAFGYPVIPALYILIAGFICVVLLVYKPAYTWPGLFIVLAGIPIFMFLENRARQQHIS